MVRSLNTPPFYLKLGGNMTKSEFSAQFDVLYNNITSNQAPGLNEYEKSVFLTKAQNELLKNYFLADSPSNLVKKGFDDTAKRQIDFSSITSTSTITTFNSGLFDTRSNTKSAALPKKVMIIINEKVAVTRGSQTVDLVVIPITYRDYDRLMSKPFKRPLKYQAWRLLDNNTSNQADLIIGPNDTIKSYSIRYLRRPNPIILEALEEGLTIDGESAASDCELDTILHEEILQRAVELAKIAWTTTGQENLEAVLKGGQRVE